MKQDTSLLDELLASNKGPMYHTKWAELVNEAYRRGYEEGRSDPSDELKKWLQYKSKCPECGAKDMLTVYGTDYTSRTHYLRCSKCRHTWDQVAIKTHQGD